MAAVAVDGDRAVALEVSDDVARLLPLERRAGGWVVGDDPVIEPMKFLVHSDRAAVEWSIGPLKVTTAGRTTWMFAGGLADPSPRIGARVGDRSTLGAVNGDCFAAVVTDAPTAAKEIVLSGLPADSEEPLWTIASTPANELTELSDTADEDC